MGIGAWFAREGRDARDAGKELWGFARTHRWKRTGKKVFKPKYWGWWLILIVVTVASVMLSLYRDQIITAFAPHQAGILAFPASWLFPVLLLISISFPPLFGQELVILVVGVIWGLWYGFAIACAGTFLGELACFFVFKYFLTARAQKIEDESVFYACLARLMRDGGIGVVILMRYSAVPGHVVTAVQSTVGMSIWLYSIAVIASLPKQFCFVYLGVIFGSKVGDHATESEADAAQREKYISYGVFLATILSTIVAMYVIWMRARRIYPDVAREYEQRKFLTEEAKRLAGEAPQLPRVRHESTLGMSMGHELEGRSKEGLLEGDLEKGEREHREVVYGGGSGLPTFTHVALGTSYDAQEQYPPYRHLPMGSEGTEVYHGEGPYGGVTSYAMPEYKVRK